MMADPARLDSTGRRIRRVLAAVGLLLAGTTQACASEQEITLERQRLVDKIEAVQTGRRDKPLQDVVIESANLIE